LIDCDDDDDDDGGSDDDADDDDDYIFLCSMTGVGGRPEVIVEGSNSLEGPWKVCHEPAMLFNPIRCTFLCNLFCNGIEHFAV
jgi:hypothetical protein